MVPETDQAEYYRSRDLAHGDLQSICPQSHHTVKGNEHAEEIDNWEDVFRLDVEVFLT